MSTGFGFGAKTTAAPTFGSGTSLSFGTPQQQPQQQSAPQFGFGTATGTPSLFGNQQNTGLGGFKPAGFGAATSQPSQGFGFGAATSTPATGGFGFGSTTPASTGLTFGTPSSTPAQGLSFGAPANTGLSFGTPASSAAPNLSFGTAASTGTGINFGATAPANTGLSFGTPATASTGLSFGTPASTAPSLSFGTATTSAGLSFGTPAASTGLTFGTSAASTGLTFGTPAATSTTPSFGLGSSTSTAGLSFGTTTSSAPSTGINFGGSAATSAPTLGLSFGTATTTTPSLHIGNVSSSGLSFGNTNTSGSSGFGLLNATTTSAPSFGLGATTTQQSVGLGGIPATTAKPGTAVAAQKEVPPKEQSLPNEFMQCVEQFKNWVQEEKNRSSEVARCSVKEFHKVEKELDCLNNQFIQLENQLQINRKLAEQLKFDTAKSLQHIEIAQRTQETPPGLQYDNVAPLQFFMELADSFEKELQELKVKIDSTEKFVKKCNEGNVLTSQDLTIGLKRLHETFVALAGRMQSIHNQVEMQKERFLKLRKQMKDYSNPFETSKHLEIHSIMKTVIRSPPKLATGPTPFNNMALGSNNIALLSQQTQQPSFAATTTPSTNLSFGLGNTSTLGGGSNSLFQSSGFGNQSSLQNTSGFQLQKPPTGNKRGKQ